MERRVKILIYGASHTGITFAKMLFKKDFEIYLCDHNGSTDPDIGDLFSKNDPIRKISSFNDYIYFVLYDDDSKNIQTSLSIKSHYKDAKIYTVLSQNNLAEKVKQHLNNFHFINQAELATQKFVEAAIELRPIVKKPVLAKIKKHFHMDPLIRLAVWFVGSVMLFSTLFFHFYDGLPLVDSFYFTITMMATVGFGDYSLKDHDNLSKIVGSIIMILSVTGTAIIFALIADSIIRKRKELTHGISKYRGKDHIIVVGGGSVGSKIILQLLKKKENPILIDKSIDGKYVKDILDNKVPFIIGDAKDERLLVNANISKAKAIIAVTQDDLTNLEVGLDSKNIVPDIRVVLRIYSQDVSSSLRENNIIQHCFSMSYIAAEYFVNQLEKEVKEKIVD